GGVEVGRGGDVFEGDFRGGTIRRIRYVGSPPTASATADALYGTLPLTVHFDGSGSSDPQGRPLTYSWDLNGDGIFGDSTAVSPSFTYSTAGTYTVKLQVTNDLNAT